ncbi:hypothetical protein [Isoalcanivorax pacificus]|uniref:hypothetical protein n=1 Tax=Isoalcanivorax pacificus TaxID=1306787 RepID=UPI001185684B|nr:hypothetical protein [Isoalcanivorax pacificus]
MKYLKACLVGLGIWGAATPSVATHFLLSVDPVTGLPALFVGSGVVTNSPGAEPPGRGGRDESPIQPAQVVQLDSETTAAMIAQTLAGSDVIAALLQNKAALDAENAALMAALNQSLGGQLESSGDLAEAGLRADMNELVASIIGAALASTTVTEEEARALIERTTGELASRPSASPPLQSGGQAASELEARQRELREQAEQRRQQQAEQAEQAEQQREQAHQRNQELIAKIEEQRRQNNHPGHA